MGYKIVSAKKKYDTATVIVEVEWKDFIAAETAAYENYKTRLQKEKKPVMPISHYKKTFGDNFLYLDAIEILKGKQILDAVDSLKYDHIASPEMKVRKINPGDGAVFELTLHIEPDITVTNYKGISAVRKKAVISEEELNANLMQLVQKYATIEEIKDRPAMDGDTVNLDFEGFVDGVAFEGGKAEGYDLVIGSGSFISGFEEQLTGLEKGGEKTIKVTFPEDYAAQLAGKDAEFKCRINRIGRKVYPELNDGFAAALTDETGRHFKDLEDMKKSICEHLSAAKNDEYELNMRDELLVKVIEANNIELPELMYENEIDIQMQGMRNQIENQVRSMGLTFEKYLEMAGTTEEKYRESLRERCVVSVKGRKALKEIARIEGITVTDEELDREFNSMAQMYGLTVDQMKSSLGSDYEKFLRMDILTRKALEVLVSSADIKEEME